MKIVLTAVLSLVATLATAHPLAPVLLELRAGSDGLHHVEWRVPALQAGAAQPLPVLPSHCEQLRAAEISRGEGGALIARWPVRCASAELSGETLAVSGLIAGGSNAVVRVIDTQGGLRQALLDAASPRFVVPLQRSGATLVLDYVATGAAHLLRGADHLLFLLGVLLLVQGWRRLLVAITAFTVGHSLTLALAVLGLVSFSPMLMEIGIAFSLVLVARAVLTGARTMPARQAGLVTGAFGLLHGLGFAGAMREIGLPAAELPWALLGFNIGIELAQLGVVGAALLVLALLSPRNHARFRFASAYAVGGLGMMWVIDRAGLLLA